MYTNFMVLRQPVEFSSQIVDSAGLAFAASPSRYPLSLTNDRLNMMCDDVVGARLLPGLSEQARRSRQCGDRQALELGICGAKRRLDIRSTS